MLRSCAWRCQIVLAAGPKNIRRMSLSMPTISYPLPAKKRTASPPIKPAAPVTTATLMVSYCSEDRRQRAAIVHQPLVYVGQRRAQGVLRPPPGFSAYSRVVGDVVGHVRRRRFRHRIDPDGGTRQRLALARQLEQGDADIRAAADIGGLPGKAVGVPNLQIDQAAKIGDVQDVAHLRSGAAVADIGELAAEHMTRQPQPDEALVDLAHLP